MGKAQHLEETSENRIQIEQEWDNRGKEKLRSKSKWERRDRAQKWQGYIGVIVGKHEKRSFKTMRLEIYYTQSFLLKVKDNLFSLKIYHKKYYS